MFNPTANHPNAVMATNPPVDPQYPVGLSARVMVLEKPGLPIRISPVRRAVLVNQVNTESTITAKMKCSTGMSFDSVILSSDPNVQNNRLRCRRAEGAALPEYGSFFGSRFFQFHHLVV